MKTFVFYIICLLYISDIAGQSLSIKKDSIKTLKINKKILENYILEKCIINKKDTIIIVYEKTNGCIDSPTLHLNKIYSIDINGLNMHLYYNDIYVSCYFIWRKLVFPYNIEVYKSTCKDS